MSTTPLNLDSGFPSRSRGIADAWADIVTGLSKSWIWFALAMQDIQTRYRGSMLGPFWLTLSNVIMIVGIGVIWARLFHQDIYTFMPYLMIGLTLWQFISTSISDGCYTFLGAQEIIQQVPMPFSVHAFRVVCRNFVVLAHTGIIIPIGLVLLRAPFGWRDLEVIPGLLILWLNCVWIAILFGLVSARFRDVPPIITNLVGIFVFITPIFWPLDALGEWKSFVALSPFFAAIDIIRAPLLGVATEPSSWTVMLALTIIGWVCAFTAFARYRRRVAFWV